MILHAREFRFKDRVRVIIPTADGSRELDEIVLRVELTENDLRKTDIDKHVSVS